MSALNDPLGNKPSDPLSMSMDPLSRGVKVMVMSDPLSGAVSDPLSRDPLSRAK